MSTTFPTTLDTYVTLFDNTDAIVAAHPNNRGDAIEAIEAKLGVDSSAVVTTHDYKLTHLPAQATDFDAGSVEVRAETFESDVATGTPPIVVASTTECTNLNAAKVGAKAVSELVQTAGNQTVAGIKTFSSFSIGPSTAPTTDYQYANKKYVDDAAGKVVQHVYNFDGTYATGSTAIPFDNTIPQKTEGYEFITLAITPTNASNLLEISVIVYVSSAGSAVTAAALFQDTTANALAVGCQFTSIADETFNIPLTYTMVAGTTSETTFKIRIGNNGGSAINFNGNLNSQRYGGVFASHIIIKEIKV